MITKANLNCLQRRHYEAIAGILKGMRPLSAGCAPEHDKLVAAEVLDVVTTTFADALEVNPQFDRARFLKACDYGA